MYLQIPVSDESVHNLAKIFVIFKKLTDENNSSSSSLSTIDCVKKRSEHLILLEFGLMSWFTTFNWFILINNGITINWLTINGFAFVVITAPAIKCAEKIFSLYSGRSQSRTVMTLPPCECLSVYYRIKLKSIV